MKAISPRMNRFLQDQPASLLSHTALHQANRICQSYAAEIDKIRSEKSTSHLTSGHQTVFHTLLNSDLPSAEKTSDRLGEEALGLIGAGTFTT